MSHKPTKTGIVKNSHSATGRESDPPLKIAAMPPTPERTDIERDPQREELLARLRAGFWQDAQFLYETAKEAGATFRGVTEHVAVDCLRGFLAEVSLWLKEKCSDEGVASVQIERKETEVTAQFGDKSVDFLDLIRTTADETDRISPQDAERVSQVLITHLFNDEISVLPGFARSKASRPDRAVLTRLPGDATSQLQQLESRQPAKTQ